MAAHTVTPPAAVAEVEAGDTSEAVARAQVATNTLKLIAVAGAAVVRLMSSPVQRMFRCGKVGKAMSTDLSFSIGSMESRELRLSLCVSIALALLAGCGGSQPPIDAPLASTRRSLW